MALEVYCLCQEVQSYRVLQFHSNLEGLEQFDPTQHERPCTKSLFSLRGGSIRGFFFTVLFLHTPQPPRGPKRPANAPFSWVDPWVKFQAEPAHNEAVQLSAFKPKTRKMVENGT